MMIATFRHRTTRRRTVWVTAVIALSLVLGACQSGPTAEQIVARMKEVEAGIEDAHAVVEFSLDLEGLDADVVVELWERTPNQFRAEVLRDSSGEFQGVTSVTDGEQVWLYHPEENEVVTGRVGEFGVDEPLSPHQLIDQMREVIDYVLDHSDVELAGEEDIDGEATYKLVCTPRDDDDARLPLPLLGTTTLWVEKDRWVALKAHVAGGPLGEGTMLVRSYAFNEGVAPDRFKFEIPDGATIRTVDDLQPTHLTLDEALLQAEFALRVPAYVPEGTTLIDVFETDSRFVLRYDHGDISFTIVQMAPPQDREMPAGDASEVTVRGKPATLITTDQGNALLTWAEDGVSITVGGRISEGEILKVAESLQ